MPVVGRTIYLDHAASSPLRPEAIRAMQALMEPDGPFANPASVHRPGRQARRILEEVREALARELGANPAEIVFTSGGTEADNLAVMGAARGALRRWGRRGIVVSAIEHHAVLEAGARLREEGFCLEYAACDGGGVVTPQAVSDAVGRVEARGEAVAVIALMLVNNEVGTRQPVPEVAELAHRVGAVLAVDAVQGPELEELSVDRLGCDLLTLSAHKFGGPKGVGVLYVRRDLPLEPLFWGGGQERQLRPGTPNTLGIAGLGAAWRWVRENRRALVAHKAEMESRLLEGLRAQVEDVQVNGDLSRKVPGILNLYTPGVAAETLLVELDIEGVACSSGAACTAGSLRPSHVLLAMGLGLARAECSVRVSVGWTTTPDEIDEAVRRMAGAIRRIRSRRGSMAEAVRR